MLQDLKPTLYGYYRSTAAYRVRIALGLKGLNVNHAFVHLRNGEQTSAHYLAINPAGLVPYWIEGDLNLAQSIAIIEYLEEAYPDPPLLPIDLTSRAIVREIALAVCCDIHPIGNLRVLNRLQTLGVGEADRMDWSRHWIDTGFRAIEARLARHPGPFAFGERPVRRRSSPVCTDKGGRCCSVGPRGLCGSNTRSSARRRITPLLDRKDHAPKRS